MKKLFSEFASCWGGATVTTTAEPAVSRPRTKRTAKVSGAAHNWKPKLNAISENSPIFDGDDTRRPVKAKTRSPARAAPLPPPPRSLIEDYWKYSQTMAVPVFAPTSYLF
ncbi:hypothetical protein SASPL_153980 [Salvia splendens]|uniref:Uncharacterized protein n=1 Tax=Salvia splendens TaxID=180675 RepID=A0A8X8YY06_SALSN|nr:uncharacterized protein LOC121786356 [Salvia splendens]KAG6385152.1 hypothetical protein SASPL_153980 [Salvia splendens]